MAKAKKTAFFCQNCGYESAKWMGQCPACREWNTFVEEPMAAKTPAGNQGLGSHSAAGRKPVHLTEISTGKEERIPTGIGELDRVLGGGIVPGSLTLVGGDPGIGKSTLLLQVCRMLSTAGHQVLYISGEESLRQIKLRAVWIGEFNEICPCSVRRILTLSAPSWKKRSRRLPSSTRSRPCITKRSAPRRAVYPRSGNRRMC